MPNIPCPVSITCGAGETDDPRANFSSEAPDVIRFATMGWGPTAIDPSIRPDDPPTVPNGYLAPGCISLCFSSVSQEEADRCAALQAYLCIIGDGDVVIGGGGGGGNQIVYRNSPQSCHYTCPDGTTFVTTVGAGEFAALTQVEADRVALATACEIAANSFICLGALATSNCVGNAYSSSATVLGGTGPITFTLGSGTLPPGLALSSGSDGRTVILSGTTTTAGIYDFQISMSDAVGHTAYKLFTIAVAGIDQATLPDADQGVAYTTTLTASNMVQQVFWDVSAGALPSGLSLNSTTGVIYGTPTASGTSTFTVRCTDAAGLACTRQFSIVVIALACPTLKTTIVLPTHFNLPFYWVQYSDTPGDLVNPHKWFNSDFTAVDYHDADSDLFLGTTNLPAGHRIWGYSADSGNSRIYIPGAENGFAYVLPFALNVNSLAFTSGPHYTTGGFHFPAYDSVHNQVAFFSVDGPGLEHLIIFDGTTLALVSDFTIGAVVAEAVWASCYDPTRDIYFVSMLKGGVSWWIRGFRRTDGAKVFEQSTAPQSALSIRRIASVDKLYIGTWDTVNYRCIVMDPGTGAIEAQILLTDSIGYGAEDYSAKGFAALTGPNSTFFIRVSDNTLVCRVTGAGQRGAVHGSKFANFQSQNGDLLVYQ